MVALLMDGWLHMGDRLGKKGEKESKMKGIFMK